MTSLEIAVEAFSEPGDSVPIQPPVLVTDAVTFAAFRHSASGIPGPIPAFSDAAQHRADQKSDFTYPSEPHSARSISVNVCWYSEA